MRKLLAIALIFVCSKGYSINYYFSNSGDDSRSSVQAQNPNTPWASITKLNSFFTSLNGGDSVLFKRGDSFSGTIRFRKSGLAGLPIVIGAYGSGAKPIITGLTSISAWTNLGSNIWESTSAVSTLSTLNMVVINGVNTAMGRWPNSTYATITSHSGNTSITDASLPGSPTYIGGQVVIRKNNYVIDRNTITNQSGTTITYTAIDPTYSPQNGWGYFIENNVNTLDVQNEWYYNPSTKKLRIYSTSSPTGVQVATVDTLINSINNSNLNSNSYITINNLSLTGANSIGYETIGQYAQTYNTIQNCDFSFIGEAAIQSTASGGFGTSYLTVTGCTFSDCNDYGIDNAAGGNTTVTYNTFSNIGQLVGMGNPSYSNFIGIKCTGSNAVISNNTLNNIGFNGIYFDGDATIVNYNFIKNFCSLKDDGGGIYTYPNNGARTYTERQVKYNTIIDGIGATAGTNGSPNQAFGIYCDGESSNFNISYNNIDSTGYSGIFLNNSVSVAISYNTTFLNPNGGVLISKYNGAIPISGVTINNNIFAAKNLTEKVIQFVNSADGQTNFYTGDNNYYARPISDNTTMSAFSTSYTLAGWQTFFSQDLHSKKSPKSISDTSQIRFYYNETSVPKIFTLGAVYIDMAGVAYNGSITLQPYTSAVLIYSTASTLPLSASATYTSISCNGGTSTVTASASGGSSPYTYSIDGGSYQSSVTFNSIAAGTHTITAKDAANTLANYGLNISQPTAITGYVETTTAPATVTTTASGGTGTLTYKIDAGSYQSSNIFTGVAAGNHTITVKDANTCTFPIAFTVIAAGVPLAISASSTDPDCYGGNGSVTIGASGGTAPYSGTGVFAQAAGTVTYTVTDNVGAQKDTTITITNPPQVSIIQIITNNILVYGGSDTAFVSATGGTGTLTYQIDGGGYQANDTFPTVSAGNHTIDVKDANNCVNSQSFTMPSVPAPPPSSQYILQARGRIPKYKNVH